MDETHIGEHFMPSAAYVSRRLLQAIPLILGVIVFNFLLIHVAPGDPIAYLAGEFRADPSYIEMMRRRFGLDRPLYQQLIIYVLQILQGDFGYSLYHERPVLELVVQRIPNTVLLMVPQLLIASSLGVYLGIKAAAKVNSKTDNAVRILSVLGYSIPVFWLAQILMLTFAIQLGILPTSGMTSLRTDLTGLSYVSDVLAHMVLPLAALVVFQLPLVARLSRTSMLEALSREFILTAKSKGLEKTRIIYRHALPNALLPVITTIGMNVGYILAGAVLTETVFAWPGLGRLMFDSILIRDYPVIMALLVITTILVVLSNIVTDLLYSIIDPRVTYE